MPDSTPEQTEQSAALGSQSVPPPTPEAVAAPATDERVHPESDFQAQVQRLIQQRPLGGDTTEARAFHNDLTLTVNREASALLASTTCDQQRDLAASVWLKWSEMDVGPRCRRHDPVVHRPHTRECRRGVHRAAVPLRLKLNINHRRGYAAQS